MSVQGGKPVSGSFLWVEEGEETIGPVAEVAPVLKIDRTYMFAVPSELSEKIEIGQRVMVPLRKSGSLSPGFVVRLDQGRWDSTLRPIDSVIDTESFLTPELVELGRQISGHYCCPLGATLKAMTPQAVRERRGIVRVRFVQLIREAIESASRIGIKQRAVIEFLSNRPDPVEFGELTAGVGVSSGVVRGMARKGLLEITVREEERSLSVDPGAGPSPLVLALPARGVTCAEPFELNSDQRRALGDALQAIKEESFRVLLLFGVSGSGKTEVYIRAMEEVIRNGRQAIFLVPEIVLTTQLANRLAARFPKVAIQHSGLTEAERAAIWRQIAAGERNVIVGTRSAVFAPCPNLGLIVVDEEQESSFKNLQAPRFHVRDVSIMRAKQLGIPAILGSATPSLETWHKSQTRPDYVRITMPKRVRDLPMPRIHVVDMREEIIEAKSPVVLSRTMIRMLGETLDRREQALILMNRRGFAQRIFCIQCKARLVCSNCSTGMTVHASSGLVVCHYCRMRVAVPAKCPQVGCGGKLIFFGSGTQKVEQVLGEKFPHARLQRVDSDVIQHREQYEKLIADFEAGRVNVLVGTQMIAKGLDFPHVSFVGMVHTESDGFASDFRAHERLFQLVTQFAGRAGRAGTAGEVVIQTINPDLPALKFALNHDYAAFASQELAAREKVGFPPFRRLVRVIISHERDEHARRESHQLAQRVQRVVAAMNLPLADVLGPAPAAMIRLKKQYRYDVLLRTATATDLRKILDKLRAERLLSVKTGNVVVDVDPVSLA